MAIPVRYLVPVPTLLGPIVRLQVQRAPLKVGAKPDRVYTPGAIVAAETLRAGADGVIGVVSGTEVLDVHHRAHPASRNSDGANGLSIGFTSHYQEMQRRFGAHMTVGVAGENIIVDVGRRVEFPEVSGGLVIVGRDGREKCRLLGVAIAHPCREFSGFALQTMRPDAETLKATLQVLDNGLRGFYCTVSGAAEARLDPGDALAVLQ